MHCATPPDPNETQLAEIQQRRMARSYYWKGWPLREIARELDVNYNTVASWKRREKWDAAAPVDVIEDRIEAKIATLLDKEPFTEGDMKRVDFLTRQMERTARIRKYGTTGKEGDLNPRIEKRNDDAAKAKRAEKRKNFLTLDQWQALLDDFEKWRFEYQDIWWDNRDQRTRKIRKARQIGATV
ncbi:terminase gpP N-terminus-related DNA-binding protein, partial [Alteraurantiacibacter buctensis]